MSNSPNFYGTMRAYQLISDQMVVHDRIVTGYTTNNGSYGLVLPDISTILLNASALDDNTT